MVSYRQTSMCCNVKFLSKTLYVGCSLVFQFTCTPRTLFLRCYCRRCRRCYSSYCCCCFCCCCYVIHLGPPLKTAGPDLGPFSLLPLFGSTTHMFQHTCPCSYASSFHLLSFRLPNSPCVDHQHDRSNTPARPSSTSTFFITHPRSSSPFGSSKQMS